MPAIQSLKKQLRGIRSTLKLTKAMKTISTVKFSKLNTIFGEYTEYSNQCARISEQYGAELSDAFKLVNKSAPHAIVVFSSNKGLCGSFNSELLNFAFEKISELDKFLVIACGKKAISYFNQKNIPIEKEYILNDIPSYEESAEIFDTLAVWRQEGKVSEISVIYPQYKNMMTQRPTAVQMFAKREAVQTQAPMFVPDKASVTRKAAVIVYRAFFHRLVLESAIGAQAATLTTMRSAYDTATEYCARLEGQINRLRQSAVTADVIEVSSERRE